MLSGIFIIILGAVYLLVDHIKIASEIFLFIRDALQLRKSRRKSFPSISTQESTNVPLRIGSKPNFQSDTEFTLEEFKKIFLHYMDLIPSCHEVLLNEDRHQNNRPMNHP